MKYVVEKQIQKLRFLLMVYLYNKTGLIVMRVLNDLTILPYFISFKYNSKKEKKNKSESWRI